MCAWGRLLAHPPRTTNLYDTVLHLLWHEHLAPIAGPKRVYKNSIKFFACFHNVHYITFAASSTCDEVLSYGGVLPCLEMNEWVHQNFGPARSFEQYKWSSYLPNHVPEKLWSISTTLWTTVRRRVIRKCVHAGCCCFWFGVVKVCRWAPTKI